VTGIDLPNDAIEAAPLNPSLNGANCIVWRSRTLGKLIGTQYAAATTNTGTDTAYMRAESSAHC
jgi:hypothetical protein